MMKLDVVQLKKKSSGLGQNKLALTAIILENLVRALVAESLQREPMVFLH